MADIQGLRRDINTITERADNMIAFDKKKEFTEGIENIKSTYGNKYTTDALDEMINEYKQKKFDETIKELNEFDEKSKQLLEQTYKRVSRVESEVSMSIDPQSQYELEKHNYILNKLQNELSNTFTGRNPHTQELDEVINQAQHDKLYANALLQTRNLLIRNINDNENMDVTEKEVFKNRVNRKLTDIRNNILPKEYNELQDLKEKLGNNQSASKNKTHMFKFVLGMNNEPLAKAE